MYVWIWAGPVYMLLAVLGVAVVPFLMCIYISTNPNTCAFGLEVFDIGGVVDDSK